MIKLDGAVCIVAKEDETLPWSGKRDGSRFRCMFCGRHFKEGDECRFQLNPKGLNFMVCSECDTESEQEILEKFKAHQAEAKTRFWYWIDEKYWQHGRI